MENTNHANRVRPDDLTKKSEANNRNAKKDKFQKPLLVLGAILLVLVAAAGVLSLVSRTGVSGAIDDSRYQAVFLSNGQVYFGKLKSVNGEYMRLKNVFYLQNKADTANDSTPQDASAEDEANVELIKLGNEIHGPEDEMLISKDQVLFFENLKPAGSVSKTINNFQNNKQ